MNAKNWPPINFAKLGKRSLCFIFITAESEQDKQHSNVSSRTAVAEPSRGVSDFTAADHLI